MLIFLLLTNIVKILKSNGHKTPKGLQEIINIKASMNKGLSTNFLSQFPKTVPVTRPQIKFNTIPHSN